MFDCVTSNYCIGMYSYFIITVNIISCLFQFTYTVSSNNEVNTKVESGDNLTSDHTVIIDPVKLIGPQVVDIILNKPGMYV